jgi:hypothetical protein
MKTTKFEVRAEDRVRRREADADRKTDGTAWW